MNSYSVLLVGLLAFSSLALAGAMMWFAVNLIRRTAEQQRETQLGQLALLSKMTGILSAKDPLAFQAIQAMDAVLHPDPPFDPSDEAEARRDYEEEDLSDDDRADLRAAFG